ncbi:MAG: serine O-acetyltransferase [Succinivibrio sp.]|nr:serine O-acetyltransferase [Succinivibrio sp.]MBQ8478367.1 serine O-acetyltransferase [Succinivibrio sp.]MCI5638313.1 serine O-acetyltransferase [Succinivibrio sp.]MCI6449164.1 serine O-acetyltransferase [Succinivibrio sp.]MDD6069101.1 serine O-acetyltransferase [Succinivibrio sp.]
MIDDFWNVLVSLSLQIVKKEPALEALMNKLVLTCRSFDQCLARIISSKLASYEVDRQQLFQICMQAYADNPNLLCDAIADVYAVVNRDPASSSIVRVLLFLKGPHVLESWRVSHWLWEKDRKDFASFLQSRISDVFSVDIHPAAKIGKGLMLDHATNIVIGETAVIADTVSMLHDVTLGGTGKEQGDRHPKVGRGVMIGAGAKILGNIRIGEGAIVGAGSVVLRDVPAHTTVVGVPARVVGRPQMEMPSLDMDQTLSGCNQPTITVDQCPAVPTIKIKQV